MSLLFGGLFVLKSDRDYLLTLPLRRRDLSIALFIAQFIGSGITILFLYGFYVAGSGSLEDSLVLVANLVLLASLITALGVVSNILDTWRRVALGVVLGAWCVSALLGFDFTPVSAFTGHLLYGTLILFAVTAVFVPVALRELAYLELGSIRSILRSTASEYKKNMSFAGKGPVRAIYSYHLSFLELMGRVNIGGSTSYRTARIKTSRVFAVSTGIAAVYLYLVGFSPFSLAPLVIIIPILMGVITLVLMALGTLSNERGWLAFTAMDPAKYLRHLLLSRVLSILSILGPFGAANLVLTFLGRGIAMEFGQDASFSLRASIILLATIPAASILATYIVARVGAVQQVKEEGMMPGQFDLRQFVAVLPIYFVVGLIIISEIFLTAAIAIAVIVGLISTLLLISSSVWRGVAYRLTQKGFV